MAETYLQHSVVERQHTYYRRHLYGPDGKTVEYFLHEKKTEWDAIKAAFGPTPSKSTMRRKAASKRAQSQKDYFRRNFLQQWPKNP